MSCNNFCKAFVKRALHFFNTTFFIVLFLIPLISNASNYTTTVISQNSQTIRIKFSFEKPLLVESEGKKYAYYHHANYAFNKEGAKVPVINKLFNLPGEDAQLQIISQRQKEITIDNYFVGKPGGIDDVNTASVAYVGKYRDLSIFSINIIPIIFVAELNKVVWTEEIIVEIKTTSPSVGMRYLYKADKSEEIFLNRFLLNGANTLYTDREVDKFSKTTNSKQFIFSGFTVVFKITVDEAGLYKVGYDELIDIGFPASSVDPKNLALFNKGKEIPLFLKGVEDGNFGSNDYLEFWGEKNEKTFLNQYPDVYADPFSDKNVYWLVEKNSHGIRLIEESGSIIETNTNKYEIPFKYKETLHFEKNTHRELQGSWIKGSFNSPEFLFHPSYKFDHWYWGSLISAVGGKSFEFHLPHPYDKGNSVFVKAMFRGASIKAATNNYDGHQLSVFLDIPASQPGANLQKVGEIEPIAGDPLGTNWIGQKMASISNTSPLAQGKLKHGTNIFRIQMDQEGFLDAVLFNWFDITYYREYKADNDFIKFKLQDGFFNRDKLIQFQIEGFSGPGIEIYKLGLSKIVNGKIDIPDVRETDPYRVIFQDRIFDPDVEYVAVTENAKKKALSIEEYQPWKEDDPFITILDESNKADLILITNKLFSEEIGRLENLKEQAGYTVETVNVSQIYDVFNFGIISPLAIKEFLKYAYEHWDSSKKLKFVILVGDGSFDPKEQISKNSDLVPVLLFTTGTYGAAPSDLQYALISGDDLIPDLSIGRIPATTTDELNNYIDKIEEYQSGSVVSQWRNKALFISGADAGAGNREIATNKPVFRAQNTRLINLKLPQDIFAFKLNTQRNKAIADSLIDPDFGHNRELIEYFDDGVTFINFFGHGGGGIWSDEGIFTLDHVEDLNNQGKYPFIASMTCFTGAFENPGKEGLAEKFLMAKEKGAIAVLSSSSVGWKYNDFAIKWALHDYLWQDGMTFGEAVDLMKINYLVNPVYYTENGLLTTPSYSTLKSSMVNQYNLLGDPTLTLQKPDNNLSITLSSTTPTSGQQIQIIVNSLNTSGVGTLEISDKENVKYLEQSITLINGSSTTVYNIPDSSAGKHLKIKAYTTDGITDAAGNTNLNIERSIIRQISFSPSEPQVNDAIGFEIIAHSFMPIEHMELRKFHSEETVSSNQFTVGMDQVNDSLFRSSENYPGFASEGLKYFEVLIIDSEGNQTLYDLQKIRIGDDRPDLALDSESIRYSGNDQLQLSFKVFNDSDVELKDVAIRCFDEQGINDSSAFFNTQLTFLANETKSIYAPYISAFNDESRLFRVEIDPLNLIEEKLETNNGIGVDIRLITDHVWVDFNLGSSANGTVNDTISILKNWGFYIPAGGLSASSVFGFKAQDIKEMLLNGEQKDLRFIRHKGSNDTTALSITVKNSITQFNNPATLTAFVDTALYSSQELQYLSFFNFNEYLGLWVKMDTQQGAGGLATAAINKNGLYGLFISNDQKKPVIEITANGRSLRDGVLLSANPSIAFLLQDENGIDLKNSLSIVLDGAELSEDDLTIPDSIESANSIAVLATPELTKGVHTIEIEVADINGNVQSLQRTFNVSNANDLVIHGNYPNPFSNSTIFSYTASISNDRMEKFSLKIYTVSGHLIRSNPLPASDDDVDVLEGDYLKVGYHELLWDGTDDDGNEVANGVYFVIIKAVFKDAITNKTFRVNKKLKIARLK